MSHPFDRAIDLTAADGGFTGRTDPAWGNMVGPFGGITAATLLNAACKHPQRQGEPLALTVNFAGPVADGAFHIETTALRTTRSTQHWLMQLRQGDELAASATAVFATRRDTWSDGELPAPAVPPADTVAVTPSPARVAWSDRYEMRFVAGGWPDFRQPVPAADSQTLVWLRDEPPRPLDALALTALCDSFYPRLFRRRGGFTPAGTVSMTVHFHADAATLAAQGSGHVLGHARALRFALGFFDQRAELWGHDGRLLASSQQSVYFKA